MDGETTEDIFSAEAVGFKTSSTYLLIIIAVLTFFGILYQLWKWRNSRKATGPGKRDHFYLEFLIEGGGEGGETFSKFF